jgi:histidyl-tRNA synthetase
MQGVSGVGVSFGADRIYDVLNNLNRFEILKAQGKSLMVVNFGEKELAYNLGILDMVRKLGFTAEIYPEPAKMKKQLAYADSKSIVFVLMAGEDEIAHNQVTIKNMQTGEQVKVSLEGLALFFE